MFEKVNPSHPDKLADRIAGAIVDIAYSKENNPRCAVEVLLGHGKCHIIAESSVEFSLDEIKAVVKRIANIDDVDFALYPQDSHLAKNQIDGFKCGDNGIFRGVPVNEEEKEITELTEQIYKEYPFDGKNLKDQCGVIVCQSHVKNEHEIERKFPDHNYSAVNPLGPWTGGPDVDSGATNRKLGSDMGRAVTGGGLHGKDLSKADVSVNIYAHIKAQETYEVVELGCAIGDTEVDGLPYWCIVAIAREYIKSIGGFEKFAEWGLIRP